MALSDAALVLAANAVDGAITHMGLHSGAPGAAGTSGSRRGGQPARPRPWRGRRRDHPARGGPRRGAADPARRQLPMTAVIIMGFTLG